ncbi:hypothetical protein ACFSC3_05415 [Sphingomonas floccifaciens]|uniref:DUF4168 domain-containing protein n=1 Tax=Sphingomonas floccifaciens TaxID=1844115 RepID=A0ABW4NA91_9SPHN
MTMTDLDPARSACASSAVNRAVRDDMVAIFGSDVRLSTKPMPTPISAHSALVPVQLPSRPRGRGYAVASTMFATAIAAGLYLGSNVVGASAPVAAIEHPSLPMVTTRPVPASAPAEVVTPDPVAVETPITVEEAPTVIAAPAAAPATASAAKEDSVRPRVTPSVVRAQRPAVVTSATVRRPAATVVNAAPAPAREAAVETSATPPLIEAERRVADALRSAEQAGVRPGLLRDYRREFTLARADVFQQPDRAGRVYAMISADLTRLTSEAEDRRSARR